MGEQFQGGQPPILDLLNLEYIEQNLYRSCVVFDGQRPRLYGGQVAAQALYAAGQTVPAGRLPHSLHGYFLRQGSTLRPTVFEVERDRDGYSFSARRVVAIQNGEVIFNMAASFAEPRSGADLDAEPAPEPRRRRRSRSGRGTPITNRSSSGPARRSRTATGRRSSSGSGARRTSPMTRCCTRPSSPIPPTSPVG